jgi:hypothetical protein
MPTADPHDTKPKSPDFSLSAVVGIGSDVQAFQQYELPRLCHRMGHQIHDSISYFLQARNSGFPEHWERLSYVSLEGHGARFVCKPNLVPQSKVPCPKEVNRFDLVLIGSTSTFDAFPSATSPWQQCPATKDVMLTRWKPGLPGVRRPISHQVSVWAVPLVERLVEMREEPELSTTKCPLDICLRFSSWSQIDREVLKFLSSLGSWC